jgi:hypothetical protein
MKFSILFLSFVTLIGLINCNQSSSASIIGDYKGSYGNGVEIFNIRSDSSLTQTFSTNNVQIYSKNGEWTLKDNMIVFRPFTQAVDISRFIGAPNLLPVHPEEYSSSQAIWDSMDEKIIFSEKQGYVVVKQKH